MEPKKTEFHLDEDWPRLVVDGMEYKGNTEHEKLQYEAMLTKIVKHDFPKHPTVAMLGAGTFYFQARLNLMNWVKKDVYEINPKVREWCEENLQRYTKGWNWIMGDWKDTLKDKYDLVIYECDETFVDKKFENHINKGGLVIEYKLDWGWHK